MQTIQDVRREAALGYDVQHAARVIQELAEEEGKRLKDGRVVVRRPTHMDIAHRIGSSRETVTRMMRDLEENGHIETQGREIFLRPDFQKLF